MNIQIVSKKRIEPTVKDAGCYYEIALNNGSKWHCDENGENWIRVNDFSSKEKKVLTDKDLLKGFFKKQKNIN